MQYKFAPLKIRKVFFTGATAIVEGQPLCYDSDKGTAADVDNARGYNVEMPSTSNNYAFAGVAMEAHDANASGQWLTIAEPGSVVLIQTNQNCTIKSTVVTACAGQNYFYKAGYRGRGTALCLQTVNRSSVQGLVLAKLDDGEESGLVQEVAVVAGAIATVMAGGVTFHSTAAAPASNATYTVADGTFVGQRKRIVCDAAITTGDIDVTITTHVTESPEHLFMDADGEEIILEWNGLTWRDHGSTAATS